MLCNSAPFLFIEILMESFSIQNTSELCPMAVKHNVKNEHKKPTFEFVKLQLYLIVLFEFVLLMFNGLIYDLNFTIRVDLRSKMKKSADRLRSPNKLTNANQLQYLMIV